MCSYLFLFACIVCSLVAASKLYRSWETTRTTNELRDLKAVFTDSGEEKDWSDGFLALNEDYVGWLTVYGTAADGPVVQGADNDEYLRTNFYKQPSTAGTFFMDETVDVEDPTSNIIIYGHMMSDGTMFGTLKKYKDLNFFKENNIVRWEDRYGEAYYRLFAALIVSGSSTNTDYLNIQQWAPHLDLEQTQDMLLQLQDRAYIFQEDKLRGENQYIFLVTCDYSEDAGKLVLVGERLVED